MNYEGALTMKKAVLIPIIIGSVLVVGAAVVLGIGFANVTPTEAVTNVYDLEDQEFDHFNIDLTTADLEFLPSEDGGTRVVCEETNKLIHEVSIEEGALTVKACENRKWFESILSADFAKKKVSIYMPFAEYLTLNVSAHTGDLIVPEGLVFSTADVHLSTGSLTFSADVVGKTDLSASTGNVTVSKMTTSELHVLATTGHVTLEDVHVSEALSLETSTGRVAVNNVEADQLNIHASTGNIALTNTLIANDATIVTTTGNVTFSGADAKTLDVQTTTGNVKGSLASPKIFSVTTKTGHVNVPTSALGGLCKVTTTTGDIELMIQAA